MSSVKQKTVADRTDHRGALRRLIRQLAQRHGMRRVFEDFLTMSAISFSNAVDWIHREEREAEYMSLVQRYTKEELDVFPTMLAHLVEALDENVERPKDVLGRLFHELELHDEYKGQFFTPDHICECMGLMTFQDGDCIAEKGYATVMDPCCGSGAMALGLASAVRQSGFNYNTEMVVTAIDVDIKCVHMCYVQLSLYGIPAVVIHGNSLTNEEWSRWYTPVYMLKGWAWRQLRGDTQASESDTAVAATSSAEYDITLKEDESGQLSFAV
jgi:type I restriction-modification system DNA methylase subunit